MNPVLAVALVAIFRVVGPTEKIGRPHAVRKHRKMKERPLKFPLYSHSDHRPERCLLKK